MLFGDSMRGSFFLLTNPSIGQSLLVDETAVQCLLTHTVASVNLAACTNTIQKQLLSQS